MLDEGQENPEPVTVQPQSSFSSSSFSQRPKKGGVLLRWAIILVVLGALIFTGVSLFRSRGEDTAKNEPTPTPTIVPTDTPTPTPATSPTPTKKPTPTPTVKVETTSPVSKGLTLKILNGGGVGRKAQEASDYLVSLGYTVQSIGNAENSPNYDKGEIQITKAKESMLAALKKDVEGRYTVGSASAILSSSDSVDAVVIIGKQ